MRRLEIIVGVLSVAALTAPTWPGQPRELTHAPAEWHMPRPATPRCGATIELVAVLADPTDVADRDGEAVWLRNVEPDAVELVGWSLAVGRARRPLDDLTLAAGERQALVGPALRPLRLANRGGEVVLTDPCGLARSLAWAGDLPGHVEARIDDVPQ